HDVERRARGADRRQERGRALVGNVLEHHPGFQGHVPARQGMRMTRNSSALRPAVSPADSPAAPAQVRTRSAIASGSDIWLLWHISAATFRSTVAVVSTAIALAGLPGPMIHSSLTVQGSRPSAS